jgi:hypothetical protein
MDSAARVPDTGSNSIERPLAHARVLCDGWTASTGRAIHLAAAESTGDTDRADGDPRAKVAAESMLHPHFTHAAPCVVRRDASLATPEQVADFIRWAFLYTPCRALAFR